MVQPARIILVDDHPFILDAAKLAIEIAWPGAEVRGTGSLVAAFALIEGGWTPSLAMIDLGMPGHVGLDALLSFRQQVPDVPVVVFSGLESREHVFMAIENGAMGFIPKKLGKSDVLAAIQKVMRGEIYVPRILFQPGSPLRQEELRREAGPAAPATYSDAECAKVREMVALLTPRQREVLDLMLQGFANKVIARRLDIAEGTVKNYVSHVLDALGVATRVQAVLKASAAAIRVSLHD